MEKIGQIISTDGKIAIVEVKRSSACGEKCGSCSGGCSSTGIYVDAENRINGKQGQLVKIEIETKTIMKAAFLAYTLPLIMLVIGVVSGSYVHGFLGLSISTEVFSFLFGLALMLIAYGVVKFFDIAYASQNKIEYTITKILS